MGRVSVVVLGDIGRSPRMQYHTISLANAGQTVDLIGYAGSRPHDMLMVEEKIHIRLLAPPPNFGLVLKCLWQAATLLWCLAFVVPEMDSILLQNPPGLPALFVCWLVARIRRARLIVDWHNYTWSMFIDRWGEKNPLVRLIRYYENLIGGWADEAFCVSEAMRKDLTRMNQKIVARTFYDRPLKNVFRPVTLEERHEISHRLALEYPSVFGADAVENSNKELTKFTEKLPDGSLRLLPDRPAFLISSTSWTADENFDILFDALTMYDQRLKKEKSDSAKKGHLPDLVCVVTGKGPLKDEYLAKVPKWTYVRLCTPWLTAEDYPILMACADLGVCLHTSTSGLDLPMKAVDMLGCRVPVLAFRRQGYECIEELIKSSMNGAFFEDAKSLFDVTVQLLTGFPEAEDVGSLARLRKRLNERRANEWNWESNWKEVVEPVLVKK